VANARPFAIIARSVKSEIAGGKKQLGLLMVRGLKGFDTINALVEVKGGARASEEARSLADDAYLKKQIK
jgi:ribosomal protein S6E (S10)